MEHQTAHQPMTMVDKQIDTLNPAWRGIRSRLAEERDRICQEIRDYPTPIPRCDAQFNHLLEQRDSLARVLQRVDQIAHMPHVSETRQGIEALVDESSLSEALKQELRSMAKAHQTAPAS
jgi:hypothetical protein